MNPGPRSTLRYRPGDHVTCHNNGSTGFDPALEGEHGVIVDGDHLITGTPVYTVQTDDGSFVALLENELRLADAAAVAP